MLMTACPAMHVRRMAEDTGSGSACSATCTSTASTRLWTMFVPSRRGHIHRPNDAVHSKLLLVGPRHIGPFLGSALHQQFACTGLVFTFLPGTTASTGTIIIHRRSRQSSARRQARGTQLTAREKTSRRYTMHSLGTAFLLVAGTLTSPIRRDSARLVMILTNIISMVCRRSRSQRGGALLAHGIVLECRMTAAAAAAVARGTFCARSSSSPPPSADTAAPRRRRSAAAGV